jgi:predicted adenine nucleotide alpha hydrolase (AANH) superfamily ATPase
MNAVSIDKKFTEFLESIKSKGVKPTLLLHACCAPCLSASLERVKDYFDTTVYFYNPNIDTENEYAYRKEEAERLCKLWGVKFVCESHNKPEFINSVKGLELEPEKGKRCEVCFNLRLNKTFNKAKELGIEYFATTLTLSPLKNAELINEIGKKLSDEKTKYLETDFKKRGGYLRSIALSKELGLYRQNYCGCEFSKRKDKNV